MIAGQGFEPLDITVRHGQRAGELPGLHEDPFARMLITQALIERLGFKLEGRMRESFPIGGRVRDELVFGLLEREWRARDPEYFRSVGSGVFK